MLLRKGGVNIPNETRSSEETMPAKGVSRDRGAVERLRVVTGPPIQNIYQRRWTWLPWCGKPTWEDTPLSFEVCRWAQKPGVLPPYT